MDTSLLSVETALMDASLSAIDWAYAFNCASLDPMLMLALSKPFVFPFPEVLFSVPLMPALTFEFAFAFTFTFAEDEADPP